MYTPEMWHDFWCFGLLKHCEKQFWCCDINEHVFFFTEGERALKGACERERERERERLRERDRERVTYRQTERA